MRPGPGDPTQPRRSFRGTAGGTIPGTRADAAADAGSERAAHMEDEATQFLREFGRRGYEPLLAKVSGTVRLDLIDDDRTDHWMSTIDKGAVTVAHKGGPADCTIRTKRSFFARLARGEENAFAATLRNEVRVTGDIELLLAIQRVFPGPPRTASERRPPRGEGDE